MKKYGMLALATIFMFSVSVFAQDPTTPPQDHHKGGKKEFKQGERPMATPEKRSERMAKQLGLNDSQKAQVQALFEKQDAKHHEQMEKGEKMRNEMKSKFEAERKANEDELIKIIGQEKFQKLQTIRAEREQKMKERREKNENHSHENNGEIK